MEGMKNHIQTQDPNTSFNSHINLPLRMWNMDPHGLTGATDPNLRNEMLQEDFWHLIQRQNHKRRRQEPSQGSILDHTMTSSLSSRPGNRWYGHVTRETGLANIIMLGTVPGGKRRGRPKKCWHDNIKEWTELPLDKTTRLAEDKDS